MVVVVGIVSDLFESSFDVCYEVITVFFLFFRFWLNFFRFGFDFFRFRFWFRFFLIVASSSGKS